MKANIKVRCEICDSLSFEKVTKLRHSTIGFTSIPISICTQCGFVTVWPRLRDKDYKAINQMWYPKKFKKDPINLKDEDYKFKKWRKMWDIIEPFFKDKKLLKVLDIGSGQGWALEFLQKKFEYIEATAIEQWKPSQEYLMNKLGVEVIDKDIDSSWINDLNKKYDFVILRATLEHLKNPNLVIKQIQLSLDKGGLAYIMVPNVEYIGNQPVRTDFFRPVHLHYFSPETFKALCSKWGLFPIKSEFGSEMWGLFKSKKRKYITVSNYLKQKKLNDDALKKYKLVDDFNILKINLKSIYIKIRNLFINSDSL